MAPELFHGKEADQRSDVFALGLVLYEMAAGKPAFTGISKPGVIAAILEREPESLPPDVPALFDRLVRGCLAKNPDERLQTAHDVALQLRWIGEGSVLESRKHRYSSIAGVSIALVVIVAVAAGLIGRSMMTKPQGGIPIRTTIDLQGSPPLALGGSALPRFGQLSIAVALSHDGSTVVYTGVVDGERQLCKRRLDRAVVEPIPGTRGATSAFFSPDDQWIGFLTDDKVMKVAVAGGTPVTVAEVASPVKGMWGRDGFISFGQQPRKLIRVSSDGGPTRQFDEVRCTSVLPDAHTFLCAEGDRSSGDFQDIVAFDIETREKIPLISRGYCPAFVPPDRLIFARGGDLYAARFDTRLRKTVSEPSLLQSSVAMESFGGTAQYAASDNGTLIYVAGDDRSVGVPALIRRDGVAQPVKLAPQLYRAFALSPDGQRMAAEISAVTDSIWIFDRVHGTQRRLPLAGRCIKPIWTPDGRGVIFGFGGDGESVNQILQVDVETNQARTLLSEAADVTLWPSSISADGRLLMVVRRSNRGVFSALLVHVGKESPVQTVTERDAIGVYLSPDGRLIAWSGKRSGTLEVWVAPIDHPDRAQQASTSGGLEAKWCSGCPELFFRSGTQWFSASISTKDPLRTEMPRPVWQTDFVDTPGQSYDVSHDGSELLVIRPQPQPSGSIQVVQNLSATLRQ
jgi:hypothetical protein